MKRVLFLSLAVAALFATSCDELDIESIIDGEPIEQTPQDTLLVSTSLIEFDCNQNTYTLQINSNKEYDITIPVDWISQVKTKAMQTDSITLVIQANTGYSPRQCDITIQTKDSVALSQTIHVFQEEGYYSLAKAIKANQNATIFYQALVETGLIDTLRIYYDESFVSSKNCGDKYMVQGVEFTIDYLDTLFQKYTVFFETNAVLLEHGIHNVEQLAAYAKNIYPSDSETDYTDRNNPLNKFISYHILPMGLEYDRMNYINYYNRTCATKWETYDIEDYYSPLLAHSVLKISTPFTWKEETTRYLNRKQDRSVSSSIKVFNNAISADNGFAYGISNILVYDEDVRTQVLNNRMRISICTLIPEAMNNGARRYNDGADRYSVSLNDKYRSSFRKSQNSQFFVPLNVSSEYSYMNQWLHLCSKYDFSLKLPAVPVDGYYEIRLRHNMYGNDIPIQFYINDVKCGEPRDFGHDPEWERLFVRDDALGSEQEIDALDDTLRAHGFMKDIGSFSVHTGVVFRDLDNYMRMIICSDFYMEAYKDYYLRMEMLKEPEDPNNSTRIDMLEIVPKSIYDSPTRESKD